MQILPELGHFEVPSIRQAAGYGVAEHDRGGGHSDRL